VLIVSLQVHGPLRKKFNHIPNDPWYLKISVLTGGWIIMYLLYNTAESCKHERLTLPTSIRVEYVVHLELATIIPRRW